MHQLGFRSADALLLDVLEDNCGHVILGEGVDQLLKALILNLEVQKQFFQMVNVVHNQVIGRNRNQSGAPLLREHFFEITLLVYYSLVHPSMVIRTLKTCIALFFITGSGLVEQRMILLLFPAVTLRTGGLEWATFFVAANEGFWFPTFAGLVDVVVKIGGLSAEILPVVSVVTLGLVVLFVEWTPLCLKEEHIEIEVLLHEVDYPGFDISDRVSKGAILSIFAIDQVFGELGAKLGFILFNVIESLNSIVGEITQVLLLASVGFCMIAHV